MEDPVEEWENEEEYTDLGYGEEEVSQSKISRILSGGLWLGKKFVITGFIISSAPVVLPPLVVMSALGFAVSIPFGVVLAGYTCTEKLMNKLLPMPEASGMLDYEPSQLVMDRAEEDVGNDDEEKQVQDMKESVEMRIELVEDENKEGRAENVMLEMDLNSERDVKPEAQSEALLEGSSSQDEKPEPVGSVTRVVVAKPVEGEIESSSGKSEEVEVLKAESTSLLEKIRDEGSQSGESSKKNKKKNKERLKKSLGLVGKKEDKSAKNTTETEKNLNKVAAGTGKTDDEISTDEKNRNIEISGETGKDAVVDDRENAQVVESRSILINGNEEVSSKVVEKQASQSPKMQYAAVSIKQEDKPVESSTTHKESIGDRIPHKPEAAKGTTEISPSEKNLWDQINALRAIVGYKSEHHPTLTEELKALYVFTGVEPPSSFEDFSDIKDSQEKLRFLMSIVGVK